MELRWVVQEGIPHCKPVLQYKGDEGDWVTVPTVEVPRKPGEPPGCCGGGPNWGHTWECPN